MKDFIKCVLFFSLEACAPSVHEQAIIDYEQTTGGGTRTDLSMKVISLEKGEDITAEDSVKIFMVNKFGSDTFTVNKIKSRIHDYTLMYNRLDSLVAKYDSLMQTTKSIDMVDIYADSKEEFDSKRFDYEMKLHNLQSIADSLQLLRAKTGILASVWKCNYSIRNPFLNNVKQELTKSYVFSPQGKILASY